MPVEDEIAVNRLLTIIQNRRTLSRRWIRRKQTKDEEQEEGDNDEGRDDSQIPP